MDYSNHIAELRKLLRDELPGDRAHREMMKHRKPLAQIPEQIVNARLSAVLLLLFPKDNELHTVFIKRPAYDGVHSGQIALPGGKAEPTDRDLVHTALREAEEELGIVPTEVEVLGKLSPLYIPPSNFMVHPILGFSPQPPIYIPDPVEVEDYIELPMISFLKEEFKADLSIPIAKGQKIKARAFQMKGETIWGATSMIMAELAMVYRKLNALT